MGIDRLQKRMSKIGTIQLCKEGYVFTLLMTGEKLDNWKNVQSIQLGVLEYASEKYPIIECMKNEEGFLCMVLRPKTS